MKISLASSVTRAALVVAVVCTPVLRVGAQTPGQPLGGVKPDDMKALAAKPTPTAGGHPDLNGHWVFPETGFRVFYGKTVGNEHQLIFGIPATGDAQTDAAVTEDLNKKKDARTQKMLESGPQYKPELKDKVVMMGKDPNHYDPTTYSCQPPGVPRLGAPQMILEHSGMVILFYGAGVDPYSTYRMVPIDKPHRKVDEDFDANPMGDSVGHWDGNTLVVDTTGFDDTTWFGAAGYFHTDAMHVIERFTRRGDTLEYSATVEDPNVLTKPFDLTPQTFKKSDSDIVYNEDVACDIDGNHDFRQHADHEHNIVN